jgi:hypothetical protein
MFNVDAFLNKDDFRGKLLAAGLSEEEFEKHWEAVKNDFYQICFSEAYTRLPVEQRQVFEDSLVVDSTKPEMLVNEMGKMLEQKSVEINWDEIVKTAAGKVVEHYSEEIDRMGDTNG